MPQVLKRIGFLVLIGLLAAAVRPIQAQTATTATFSITGEPMAGILQAGDGNFYSMSVPIGISCKSDATMLCSYIYQITPTGTTSVFYPFQPVLAAGSLFTNSDGFMPVALIVGTDGNLYGACLYGGPGGGGTIFKLTGGVLSVVKSFSASDPSASPNSLIEGADGNFYFTNINGIYQLNPAGAVTTVFSFPLDNSKGNNATSLMQGSDNNFYVTLDHTPGGGDGGAIVQISPGGQWNLVHSFAADGSEGKIRGGPLAQGKDGTFFGITKSLSNTVGTVFQVSPGGAFTLVHTFPGTIVGSWNSALFVGSDGNFYGVTLQGGDTTSANCTILPTAGCGTVYQVTPSGTFSILHNFEGGIATSSVVANNPQVDGGGPTSPLVQGPGGIFYGTADGVGGSQTAFSMTVTMNPAVPPPVELTVDPTTVPVGSPVTLSWKVLNAFSGTQKVCGASVQGILGKTSGAAGNWSGPQVGTVANGIYSGTVTITPTAAGTYTYALTCGGKESGFVPLVVQGNPPLQIQTLSLPGGTVSQMYLESLNATGGMPQYHWSVNGTLPKGITFDPTDGSFMGKPLQYGQYPLMISVQDSTMPVAEMASIPLVLTVDSGLSMFKTLPNAIVAQSYPPGANVGAGGGLPPYTFQLTSGALPPGLAFNSTTGGINGIPTMAGTYSFTVFLTDSEDPKAQTSQTFSLIVAPPTLQITSGLLPVGSVGAPYATTLMATGGMLPYYWSFGTNSPAMGRYQPPGLTLATATGVLSGIPTQFTPPLFDHFAYDQFNVVVTDSENPPVMVTATVELGIRRTLQITATSIPIGVVGTTTMTQLAASGGIPPYKWAVTCDCGSLTPMQVGLSLTGDGSVLTEAPNQPINTTATITVQDSEPSFDQVQLVQPLIFLPVLLPTTTALSSSNTTSGTGETITLTANVVQTGGGPATGQVMFFNGATLLGTAPLDAHGNAILQTSFSATAVYSITAVYGGNGTLASSASAALNETVITPTISASVSPNSLTIQSGKSGQLVITLTPVGGYSGTVNFSCGTLPPHVSCSFAPPTLTIAAGSGPVTDVLTVSTNAPPTAALLKQRSEGTGNNIFAALTLSLPGPLAGMILLVRRKRLRAALRNFWMAAMLCLFCVAALTSCAGSTSKAAAGTYNISIALTVSGGVTQNISATVIVE